MAVKGLTTHRASSPSPTPGAGCVSERRCVFTSAAGSESDAALTCIMALCRHTGRKGEREMLPSGTLRRFAGIVQGRQKVGLPSGERARCSACTGAPWRFGVIA